MIIYKAPTLAFRFAALPFRVSRSLRSVPPFLFRRLSRHTGSAIAFSVSAGVRRGTNNRIRHMLLSIYLSIYLSISPSIYLSIYISIYLRLPLSLSLSLSPRHQQLHPADAGGGRVRCHGRAPGQRGSRYCHLFMLCIQFLL